MRTLRSLTNVRTRLVAILFLVSIPQLAQSPAAVDMTNEPHHHLALENCSRCMPAPNVMEYSRLTTC
jgi:hypothetical protein